MMRKSENQKLPKVLVLSATGIGSRSATGHLMAKLFHNWRPNDLLAIYTAPPSSSKFKSIGVSFRPTEQEMASVLKAAQTFAPDVIYYRPVDNPPEFAMLAGRIIDSLDTPHVLHLMDDWPSRLEVVDASMAGQMNADLRKYIASAGVCFSICDAMSREYEDRYGRAFVPIANGVRPDQVGPITDVGKPFRVLYSGALAQDMTYQSVLDVANAVSNLSQAVEISFDIRTMPWFEKAGREIADRPGVRLKKLASNRRYLDVLNQADCLVIAYNFDEATKLYTRLSLANKLPECLGSGTPVLAYGPAGIATIDKLAELDAAIVVQQRGVQGLEVELRKLMTNHAMRAQLVKRALNVAIDNFNIVNIQQRFQSLIGDVSMKNSPVSAVPENDQSNAIIAGPYSRDTKAHVDETKIIASYVSETAPGFMIDVGAHHGSAFMPFHKLGWTVHGFEPDPKNRGYLEERYLKLDRFELDARAVSDVDGNLVPFYTSEESTGISGLSAFRDTHEKVCDVETVTLKTYMKSKNVGKVDFLKIDTEGFDLMVLKGFPWDEVKPDYVECEFEDNKTTPLGYEFDDIAQYLVDRGYYVYVSEWHPIVRYGIKHQWRGLFKYPGKLQSNQAWGNLLAFKSEPNLQRLNASIDANVVCENPVKTPAEQADIGTVPEPKPFVKPAPKVVKPLNSVPVSSNRLVNYFRMFTHYYGSPPGLVLLFSLVSAGACAFFYSRVPEPWNYAVAALGVLILMFLPAYLYARNKFWTILEIANQMPAMAPTSNPPATSDKAVATLERRLLQASAEIDQIQAELSEAKDHSLSMDDLISDLQTTVVKAEVKVAESQRGIASLVEESDAVAQDLPSLVSKYMDLKRQVLRLENAMQGLKKD